MLWQRIRIALLTGALVAMTGLTAWAAGEENEAPKGEKIAAPGRARRPGRNPLCTHDLYGLGQRVGAGTGPLYPHRLHERVQDRGVHRLQDGVRPGNPHPQRHHLQEGVRDGQRDPLRVRERPLR